LLGAEACEDVGEEGTAVEGGDDDGDGGGQGRVSAEELLPQRHRGTEDAQTRYLAIGNWLLIIGKLVTWGKDGRGSG
jgi:hypothetical protein